MSNLIINIRFWYWHLQVDRNCKITWKINLYLKKEGLKGRKLIEIYRTT